MLEPTMRERLEEAGVQNIDIDTDEKGLVGTGDFPGTAKQLENRLGNDLDLNLLEMADEPTKVRCRPRS
jgi:hypothetical protein